MSKKWNAEEILTEIDHPNILLGDLRKLAKTIKVDHELAVELWESKLYMARMLAMLIMDKKLITETSINKLVQDVLSHNQHEQLQLVDWWMANQLMKSKAGIQALESWRNHETALLRRLFWYYQGRLRWVGQPNPENTLSLLSSIEQTLLDEDPIVQWAMNFTAAQIGIFQEELRDRCMQIGIDTGLYKDEIVAKNCTPNYLPDYINIQVRKIKNSKK